MRIRSADFLCVISVLNPDVIHPKDRKEGVPDRELNVRQFEMIIASRPDRMILTRTTSIELLKDVLGKAGFSSPVTGISAYERRMLVARISGCYDPIVTSDFFGLPYKAKIRYAGSLMSTFLKRLLNNRQDCGAAFRPSTGILSLVLAIDEYGQDADYVLCGIGFNKRSEYFDGSNTRKRILPSHVFAEVKILRNLARRYKLSTTEPELMPFIPHYSDS